MSTPDNQSLDETASHNKPFSIKEKSKVSPSVAIEEGFNTSEAELESDLVANELPSNNTSATNVTPTSSELGLLCLPPELRVEVLRHLLRKPHPLSNFGPIPAILNTCHTLRREAFQIMYEENTFNFDFDSDPEHCMLNNRQIHDAIRHVHFESWLYDYPGHYSSVARSRSKMLNLVRKFGSPAIVRGTLKVIFHVDAYDHNLISWYICRLRTFTNFKMVLVEFRPGYPLPFSHDFSLPEPWPLLCEILKDALTPTFGPALSFANACGDSDCGLRFYPQQYLRSHPRKADVDWMDGLDGIRLDWNQDSTNFNENPDEREVSAQIPSWTNQTWTNQSIFG